MKILFLSRWFPYPADNGAKLRILNLLKGLATVHDVHLLAFSDSPIDADVDGLSPYCKVLRAVQCHEFQPTSWRSIVGLFSPSPRSLVDTYSHEMESEIQKALKQQRYDLIIASQWQMAAYRHLFKGCPVLYEELETGVLLAPESMANSYRARLRHRLSWFKHSQYLKRMLAKQQACTVVSEPERELLSKILSNGSNIKVVPNGVEMEPGEKLRHIQPDRHTMIFTGSFRYRPNFQAMEWFVAEIFPRIREQAPEATLAITGDADGLKLPSCPGIQHLGYVDDVRPLIARAWVSVVPILSGGGTRLKVLEAMSLCTPVVSTSKGAEGLAVEPGRDILIADDAQTFADRVLDLFNDAHLRARLSENGYQLVKEKYDWNVIIPEYLRLVEGVASQIG